MKTRFAILTAILLSAFAANAQDESRYIEVTGTSETVIVPDCIHYIIEIKEYFTEEFDGNSKPEDYHTKVPIADIERQLRSALADAGIPDSAIRTEEAGNYWRQQGQDFLMSKKFDITLSDFSQIDEIARRVDSRGINSMYIGRLENKDLPVYHRQGKIAALKAARDKAAYLVEALGKGLGDVLRIVEVQNGNMPTTVQNTILENDMAASDNFRTLKLNYAMLVRFEIIDQ